MSPNNALPIARLKLWNATARMRGLETTLIEAEIVRGLEAGDEVVVSG